MSQEPSVEQIVAEFACIYEQAGVDRPVGAPVVPCTRLAKDKQGLWAETDATRARAESMRDNISICLYRLRFRPQGWSKYRILQSSRCQEL